MDSLRQPAGYFSLQKQNVITTTVPAPAAPWYPEDSLSECSLLPSPICDDAVTPDSTDFYLNPLSLSSTFNGCTYNSMSLFDNSQMHDWLSDADQDLDMSSPFSMAIAPSVTQHNHELLNLNRQATECQYYPESFPSSSPPSSSPPSSISDVGFARGFSEDLNLSAAEIQRLTAIALGRLSPPPSPLSSPKPSQSAQKAETANRRPLQFEHLTAQRPPKSDCKQSGGRAAAVNSPASKRKTSKTSHNQVEKKYRTNVNSKIAALRDCMPNLRAQSVSDSDAAEEEDNRHVSKARILTAAVEFINTLEEELKAQKREGMVLRSILQRYHPEIVESVDLCM